MNKKLEQQIKKVKQELKKLHDVYKETALMSEIALERNEIPDGMSKTEFKKEVNIKKNFAKRGVVDRLFLESLDILPTIKKSKKKFKSNNTSPINTVAKFAMKIKKLEIMSEQEQEIIKSLLKDLTL